MKKILFAFAGTLIAALAVTNETYAQTSADMASLIAYKVDKVALTKNSNSLSLDMVNAKALKDFKKHYKTDVEKWEEGVECITSTYLSDDCRHVIYYDKKGNWIASIKMYEEDQMPKDIRGLVIAKYYDYKIVAAEEVETMQTSVRDAKPTYIVTIKGESDIKLIRIYDYNLDVYKQYKRS